jgi:hypothetical protein
MHTPALLTGGVRPNCNLCGLSKASYSINVLTSAVQMAESAHEHENPYADPQPRFAHADVPKGPSQTSRTSGDSGGVSAYASSRNGRVQG